MSTRIYQLADGDENETNLIPVEFEYKIIFF